MSDTVSFSIDFCPQKFVNCSNESKLAQMPFFEDTESDRNDININIIHSCFDFVNGCANESKLAHVPNIIYSIHPMPHITCLTSHPTNDYYVCVCVIYIFWI
jgi:hypothetical protein